MPKSQKELNTELLLAIYKNIQTAKQSINNVIDKIADSKLKRELKNQFKDYDEMSESCEDLARVYEIELIDNSFFKKAKMWFTVNFSTMLDKSNTKIASINIIGSTMGVLDLMKILADNSKAKKEITNLCKALLDMEERNIERLKPYILAKSEEPKADKNKRLEDKEESKKSSNENEDKLPPEEKTLKVD